MPPTCIASCSGIASGNAVHDLAARALEQLRGCRRSSRASAARRRSRFRSRAAGSAARARRSRVRITTYTISAAAVRSTPRRSTRAHERRDAAADHDRDQRRDEHGRELHEQARHSRDREQRQRGDGDAARAAVAERAHARLARISFTPHARPRAATSVPIVRVRSRVPPCARASQERAAYVRGRRARSARSRS